MTLTCIKYEKISCYLLSSLCVSLKSIYMLRDKQTETISTTNKKKHKTHHTPKKGGVINMNHISCNYDYNIYMV